jgi:hypothetical protein
MAKGGEFGGFPQDELDALLKVWASTARPAGLTDAAWIAQLVDKMSVLEALIKEEHAGANASDPFDLVSVVMKCIVVREQHRDVLGGAPVAGLVAAIGDLEKAWGS